MAWTETTPFARYPDFALDKAALPELDYLTWKQTWSASKI
jgi:hypothetical protein